MKFVNDFTLILRAIHSYNSTNFSSSTPYRASFPKKKGLETSLKDFGMSFESLENLLPLALALVLALAVPAAMLVLSWLLGPRRSNPAKLSTYECGIQSPAVAGDARRPFNVKFYLLAMCFLVFDVEVVFLLPWAVLFQKMAWGGFFSMLAFLGILAFGWYYLLKRGGLEWE